MQQLRRFLLVLCLIVTAAVLPAGSGAAADEAIHLTVETPGYELDDQGLRVLGWATDDTPGAPALPVWTTVVELPADASWSLRVESGAEQVIPVSRPLPANPVPELALDRPANEVNMEELAGPATLVDRPDPTIYDTDAPYPSVPVQAGPEAIVRGRRLLPVRVFPFQYNPVAGQVRYVPAIEIVIDLAAGPATARDTGVTTAASADSAVPGLRVQTRERGMHRLSYEMLAAAGVPLSGVKPADLAMSYLGEPIDIEVTGAQDGSFGPGDAVLFYAEPYMGRYMTHNVYRLTWFGDTGVAMSTRRAVPALTGPPLTRIRRQARIEEDKVYYSTYELPRDADHFFDDPLSVNSTRPAAMTPYTLTLDNLLPEGYAELRVELHGGLALANRTPDQSVALRLNGSDLGMYTWDGSVTHLISLSLPAASLVPGENRLELEASLSQLPGIDLYWVSPNWAELAYPARANAVDDRLYMEPFELQGALNLKLFLPLIVASGGQASSGNRDLAATGFAGPGIQVYDVRDPRHPVRLTGVQETADAGGYTATFRGSTGGNAHYYLAREGGMWSPEGLELDSPSTLRATANAADYIAVVHRSLWDAVQPLLDHRAAEGLRVAKVDIQDVYDEFSGGRVDPEALRSFLGYAYHNWNGGGGPPAYVLLAGDGHYDFKGVQRPDLPNLIPPYLVDIDPWIGETAADNRFVSADGPDDILPDMAVGRIPAKTPADMTAIVDKILAYEKSAPPGDWQSRAVFVAETKTDSAGDFHALSDASRLALPAGYDGQALYYKADAATDTVAEMEAAIKTAMDGKSIYLQWFGHGARTFWGKERIWEVNDPAKLVQNDAWPFTASMSCWSGYFINITSSPRYGNSELTLGEAMLLAPGKGSLVDLSPTGQHVGFALVDFNQALVGALFTQRIDRAGLAVDAARTAYFELNTGPLDLIDTQVLLGDPATRLKLP